MIEKHEEVRLAFMRTRSRRIILTSGLRHELDVNRGWDTHAGCNHRRGNNTALKAEILHARFALLLRCIHSSSFCNVAFMRRALEHPHNELPVY